MFFILSAKVLFSEQTKSYKYSVANIDSVFTIALTYITIPELDELLKTTLTETTKKVFDLQKDLTTVVFNTENFIPFFEIHPCIKTIFKATSLSKIESPSESLVIENTIPYTLTADNLQELKIDGLLPTNIFDFKDKITILDITTNSLSIIDLSDFGTLNNLSIKKSGLPIKIILPKNYLFGTFSCANCVISTINKSRYQF